MSGGFDPYQNWLAIPPEEQPPHYYRLLGTDPFESTPEVIEAAADRRIADLRSYEVGEHIEAWRRLLDEVAAAKACLLNPTKKAKYDVWLSGLLSPPTSEEVGAPPQQPADEGLDALFKQTAHAPSRIHSAAAKRKHSSKTIVMTAVVVAGCAILVGGLVLTRTGQNGPAQGGRDLSTSDPVAQPQDGNSRTEPSDGSVDSLSRPKMR